jgi:hypothetical protein
MAGKIFIDFRRNYSVGMVGCPREPARTYVPPFNGVDCIPAGQLRLEAQDGPGKR